MPPDPLHGIIASTGRTQKGVGMDDDLTQHARNLPQTDGTH